MAQPKGTKRTEKVRGSQIRKAIGKEMREVKFAQKKYHRKVSTRKTNYSMIYWKV